MIKTLTRHGNSYALIIDRAILDLLRIEPDAPLEVTTDGRTLTITPAKPAGRASRVAKSLTRVNARHGRTLKRLSK